MACTVSVPVAGEAGAPVTEYVKVVALGTAIVKVPLYSACVAPATITLCPVVNPCGVAVVAVAVAAARVMPVTGCGASCAVIVPVAGVDGVPVIGYVKLLAPVTVIVKVPLYSA